MAVGLDKAESSGQAALAAARFELIPIGGMLDAADQLPAAATVSVTCSPRHGIERTLDGARALQARGHRVIPHIAARLVRDEQHLDAILSRLAAQAVDEIFVIAGDAPQAAGRFSDGLSLLEAMAGDSRRPQRIGVPAYPEGHASLSEAALLAALQAKLPYADYAVTQICFDPERIRRWLQSLPAARVWLPMYIGLPGVMDPKRLLAISMRIGIGSSLRVLKRSQGLTGRMLHGVYRPDALVRGLLPLFGTDLGLPLAGLHFNTFNHVAPLRQWQTAMLASLAAEAATP